MSTNWRTIYTKCPFYHEEDGKRIVCEGVPEETTTAIRFPSAQKKEEYKKDFCETKYKDCPYSKMLYQKWDR